MECRGRKRPRNLVPTLPPARRKSPMTSAMWQRWDGVAAKDCGATEVSAEGMDVLKNLLAEPTQTTDQTMATRKTTDPTVFKAKTTDHTMNAKTTDQTMNATTTDQTMNATTTDHSTPEQTQLESLTTKMLYEMLD